MRGNCTCCTCFLSRRYFLDPAGRISVLRMKTHGDEYLVKAGLLNSPFPFFPFEPDQWQADQKLELTVWLSFSIMGFVILSWCKIENRILWSKKISSSQGQVLNCFEYSVSSFAGQLRSTKRGMSDAAASRKAIKPAPFLNESFCSTLFNIVQHCSTISCHVFPRCFKMLTI